MENSTCVIRPIKKGIVHLISSGQVIVDLSSAVKELIENSLDAASTNLDISLKNYGMDSIQVIDNGSGISPQNFNVLGLKHHTSKLFDFPDLKSLTTFGFRGEALSSLCAMGEVTVETKTNNDVFATHLTYDPFGNLIAQRKTARQVGTTVTVKEIFSNMPVRSKEFRRNIRKEYGKLLTLLNAYAIIAKGVRFICSNTTGKNARSVVINTQGTGSIKDNIIAVFGLSTFSCLEPLKVDVSDGCVVEGFVSKSGLGSGRSVGDRQFFYVNSRPVDMPKVGKLVNELYRGANSKQYPIVILNFLVPTQAYDVNVTPDKRKVFISDETSILVSLREALRKVYSSNEVTYSVNCVQELKEDECNLPLENLLPEIAVVQEESGDKVCSSDKEAPQCDNASTIEGFALKVTNQATHSFATPIKKRIDALPAKTDKHATPEGGIYNDNSVAQFNSVQMSLNNFVTVNKRKPESVNTVLSEAPLLRSGPMIPRLQERNSAMHSVHPRSPQNCTEVEDWDKDQSTKARAAKVPRIDDTGVLFPCVQRKQHVAREEGDACTRFPCVNKSVKEDKKAEERVLQPDSVQTDMRKADSPLVSNSKLDATTNLQSSDVRINSPLVSSGSKVGFTMQFSVNGLASRREKMRSRLQRSNHAPGRIKLKGGFDAATLEFPQIVNEEWKANALAAATRELERLFLKEDFKQMKVIGQFNLGFIIGKLDEDLFIVDQHAADEKYNYECLSQSTVLSQQPLLRPIRMELSPEEEILVSMHMDVIRRNGFVLEEDLCAPTGHRFKLKAVPFSKNITFGVADIKELISVLSDSYGECSMIGSYRLDTADSICPPRVRAMLASRACRSSIMIGDSLDRGEMQKILENLATLKSPWNCPHGRPTMRHLVDLRTLRQTSDEEINL